MGREATGLHFELVALFIGGGSAIQSAMLRGTISLSVPLRRLLRSLRLQQDAATVGFLSLTDSLVQAVARPPELIFQFAHVRYLHCCPIGLLLTKGS